MDSSEIGQAIAAAVGDGIARAVAIVGLCGIALIHLLDAPGHFGRAAYIGWLYVVLILASLALAAALARSSERLLWAAAAGLAASVIVGFVLSRITGLPNSPDDIGNWGEPLGMASLFVEGTLVCLSAGVLAGRRRAAQAGRGNAGAVRGRRRDGRRALETA